MRRASKAAETALNRLIWAKPVPRRPAGAHEPRACADGGIRTPPEVPVRAGPAPRPEAHKTRSGAREKTGQRRCFADGDPPP